MSGKDEKIEWNLVRRVLVIRLRSIGDTVLATPALAALRRSLPHAEIDLLLEDWVAPLIEGSEDVDNVVTVGKGLIGKLRAAAKIRGRAYDAVVNLHGGTTSTFLARASGARHRVGYRYYRYSFLFNHILESSSVFWRKDKTHSAEQQLALVGFTGIRVDDRPAGKLPVRDEAVRSVAAKLGLDLAGSGGPVLEKNGRRIVLFHPAAATDTKQWDASRFAAVADSLYDRGFQPVAVASADEEDVLERLSGEAQRPIVAVSDLSLPEITALAAGSELFVGNDSGIAHIAAAVGTPPVVIFGSSNRDHWRPWTEAPNRVVFAPFPCQPCAGYTCEEFDRPRCILEVSTAQVLEAVGGLLEQVGEQAE